MTDTDLPPSDSMIPLISSADATCTQLQDILVKTGVHLRCVALGEYPLSSIGSVAPELIPLDWRRHVPQLSIITAQLECSEQPGAM